MPTVGTSPVRTPAAERMPTVTRMQMLTAQVVHRSISARDTVTLWLAQPGTNRAPAAYQPGQFVTLSFSRQGEMLYRSYSLSGDGRPEYPWEITVKRQHSGAVSSYLYDHAQPGTMLYVSQPRGTFTLPAPVSRDQPIVFVATGSGIAPIYGMLRYLAQLPAVARPVLQLHYASHAPDDVIYEHELAALAGSYGRLTIWHYVSSAGVRLTPELVMSRAGAIASHAHWYICGPEPLKRSFVGMLSHHGVPLDHTHAEVFASQHAAHASSTANAPVKSQIRLVESGATVPVRAGQTILESLEQGGYHPAFDCRSGSCGTCRLRLMSGAVKNAGDGLTPHERAAGYVLACVAEPAGDISVAGVPQSPDAILASSRVAAGRSSARRSLRVGAAAAALTLFASMWTFTNHSPTAAASSTVTTPSSSSVTSGDDGSSSGFTTQQVPSFTNSTSGTS